jgi:hypothetical protein
MSNNHGLLERRNSSTLVRRLRSLPDSLAEGVEKGFAAGMDGAYSTGFERECFDIGFFDCDREKVSLSRKIRRKNGGQTLRMFQLTLDQAC